MKRYIYSCQLLADLVLPAKAATEGFNKSLTYIPGARFMGLVASSLYNMDSEDKTLDIFHRGKVYFGDAHPVIKGERSLVIPFSWYAAKGESFYSKKEENQSKIYLHHEIDTEYYENLVKENIQLKQQRSGYFTTNGFASSTDQNFSIKSSYDTSKRRSKDGEMYGYFSLPKGTEWSFYIESENETYLEEVKSILEGKHRIGRSRSAEYGLVNIQYTGQNASEVSNFSSGDHYIYAESNICLYDEYGRCTANPSDKMLVEQFGLPQGSTINWEKTQLRTRIYSSWNRKRSNKNADRLIIEKGSVFAINTQEEWNDSKMKTGLGAHRSEGFGSVLINPDFLTKGRESDKKVLDMQFTKVEMEIQNDKLRYRGNEQDDNILSFLGSKSQALSDALDVDKAVNTFIANYGGKFSRITSSQWGQVRNLAKNVEDKNALYKILFNDKEGILLRGQSQDRWRKGNCYKILENAIISQKANPLEFTAKLAAEMAKSKN